MVVRHLFPEASAHAELPGAQRTAVRNGARDLFVQQTSRIDHSGGWHIFHKNSWLKLLERIELIGAGDVQAITTTGASTYIQYSNGATLGCKPLATLSGITFQSDRESCFKISLDVRKLDEYPEFGREYSILRESEGLLICYSDQTLDTPVYIHVRSRTKPELKGQWTKAKYLSQEPLYVYDVATYQTTSLALGYGQTPEQARSTSLAASRQRPTKALAGGDQGHETLITQVATARLCCQRSLRWLSRLPSEPTSNLIVSLGRGRDVQQAALLQSVQQNSIPLSSTLWLALVARQYTTPDFPKPLAAVLTNYFAHSQPIHKPSLQDYACQALQQELLYTLTANPLNAQRQASILGEIRANKQLGDIAMAYLLQPQLYSKPLWHSQFDTILDPTCLEAVAMHRFDPKRYAHQITASLERETRAILWSDWLGHAGTIDVEQSVQRAGLFLFFTRELDGYGSGQTALSTSAFWEATTEDSRVSFWT